MARYICVRNDSASSISSVAQAARMDVHKGSQFLQCASFVPLPAAAWTWSLLGCDQGSSSKRATVDRR